MIWLVVGFLLGALSMLPTVFLQRTLLKTGNNTKETPRRSSPPRAVVNPSYEPPVQGTGSAHVVMPKSPGQIEYEAEQRAMKKTLVERSLERK
jgi:hypothetical protein